MHSAISRTQQACPCADCVICNGTHRGSKLAQADRNMASRTALLLYVLAMAPMAYADDLTPSAEYEGKAVVHVRFEPATQPLASGDLNRLVALAEGSPLHLADVRAAIKRLYATGDYSHIEVATEPAPGGLNLVFRTTTQWFVGPVEVTGKIHLPPSTAQLASATRLDLGTPFNDGDVDTAVNNLRTLLERNGLYHGRITPTAVVDPG